MRIFRKKAYRIARGDSLRGKMIDLVRTCIVTQKIELISEFGFTITDEHPFWIICGIRCVRSN